MNWRLRINILWEPRDLWLGVYVAKMGTVHVENWEPVIPPETRRKIYVCLLPCLPIVFTFWRYKNVLVK